MRSSLNICTWNVGGLMSDNYDKITDPDFLSQINPYDLVLLTETHLGYEHNITIDNYLYYPFCRNKSKNNRYFGGLGIFIRKSIRNGVKFMNDGTSEYQWIKLCKNFFNFRKDLYLCLVYYSPKSELNLIEIIEKDIINKYNKGDILLAGDLNSRTGSSPDFIQNDTSTHIPIPSGSYDIDLVTDRRVSQDNVIDTRGRELLDMCIGNQLRILNGRCFGNTSGRFTCFKTNGCSVVDYIIASESLLNQVLYMNVSEFIANMSDCHCKLSVKLLANFEREANNEFLFDFPLRYNWNQECVSIFQESFSHPAIQLEINTFLKNKLDLQSESINTATEQIHSIFDKVCKLSLKRKKIKKKNAIKHKKWFDGDLERMKKELDSKGTLMSKFPRDPIIRGSFFKLNKMYSKLRKKKKYEFKQNILDRLDNLYSDDPKEYWSLVNSLRNEKNNKPETSISAKEWLDYFTNLTSVPNKMKEKVKKIEEKLKEYLDGNIHSFSELDFGISLLEIQKAISKLKSGKSPGLDNISNEMLKVSQSFMNPCLLKLFNAVFRSGHYPKKWSESYLSPIFKSQDPKQPENYRGIAINNSIGKLFNIILCNRLNKFLSDNKIIHETQIGFSKKARTADHIFVLKCIIDKYMKLGNKKLYTCFIDFRKAFDKVIHVGIMLKLLKNNIDGCFYQLLNDMYSSDRLCIRIDNKITDFFTSEVGVRQGDVLSPNLFKLFINDLPPILEKKTKSVDLKNKFIPCLLYADDLVLFSDSKNGLQEKLDVLDDYCKEWCLEINSSKTKIIIFNKNGRLLKEIFTIGGDTIECVKNYKYLGIIMSNNGNFNEAKKILFEKALKASFKLYKEVKNASPSIKTLLHIYDHTIKPIVLYGCENWGVFNLTNKRKSSSLYDLFKNWEPEKLDIKFCKYLLGVSKYSTNIAVLSELGRFPMFIDIITHMFMYWHRLEHSPSELLNSAYNEYISTETGNESSWYSNILFFSEKLGLDLSICKNLSQGKFKSLLKKTIKRHFTETWHEIKESYSKDQGKLDTYFKFKLNFEYENYLNLKNSDKRQTLSRFRLSNHRLRVETGRHERRIGNHGKSENIPRYQRVCRYCSMDKVEDEFHFLFECELYTANRREFFNFVSKKYPNLQLLNNNETFVWFMVNEDNDFILNLVKFITDNYSLRNDNCI